jgi:exodeoxyribonuclease-3
MDSDHIIKIMSFNIAAETLCLNNNSRIIIRIIKSVNPDILGIQEINCHDETTNVYTNINLYKEIACAMKYFYELNEITHTVIFSKMPIIDTSANFKGMIVKKDDMFIAILNIHLIDEPYQPYQVAKIPYGDYPFVSSEPEAIEQAKKARGETIQEIYTDIKLMEEKYNLSSVIVLGDFNEPSHRDWTTETANAGIHPLKIEFPSVKYFEDAGFIDSFRFMYPNPLTVNGFTWPTANKYSVKEALEDRIDYILVKSQNMKIIGAGIIGETEFESWPSDHRACVCILSTNDINYFDKYIKYKSKYLKFKKIKRPFEL